MQPRSKDALFRYTVMQNRTFAPLLFQPKKNEFVGVLVTGGSPPELELNTALLVAGATSPVAISGMTRRALRLRIRCLKFRPACSVAACAAAIADLDGCCF